MRRSGRLIRQEDDSTAGKIGVVEIQRGLIEWGKPIGYGEAGSRINPEDAIAEVVVRSRGRIAIECAVPGGREEVAVAVGRGRAASHPNSAEASIRRAVIRTGGLQGRSVVADHPTVVRTGIFVGSPGDIH